MKQFSGFPPRMEFTSIPNVFFSTLLPQISDIAELKTTLHILAVLYRKKGHLRFVSYTELLGNAALMKSLSGGMGSPGDVLKKSLKMAAERGTFLHLALDRNGTDEDVYFLNTPSNQQTLARIQNGELELSGMKPGIQPYVEVQEPPDIFTLYEQNIGMLTPLIADELREAEKLYAPDWIRDAIKEAVNQGKRKWSYISAVLERWSVEGKSDGAYQRDIKKTDPDRFIKGKYGHMVRR